MRTDRWGGGGRGRMDSTIQSERERGGGCNSLRLCNRLHTFIPAHPKLLLQFKCMLVTGRFRNFQCPKKRRKGLSRIVLFLHCFRAQKSFLILPPCPTIVITLLESSDRAPSLPQRENCKCHLHSRRVGKKQLSAP